MQGNVFFFARVTRLGEYLPIGRLLSLGRFFLKITEVAQNLVLLSRGTSYV
jgi:hypothetical protein